MSNKAAWENYKVVKETDNFAIMHNPDSNPLEDLKEEKKFSYYLIYKPYGTIEGCANSIILISNFLDEAEKSYQDNQLDDKDGLYGAPSKFNS